MNSKKISKIQHRRQKENIQTEKETASDDVERVILE